MTTFDWACSAINAGIVQWLVHLLPKQRMWVQSPLLAPNNIGTSPSGKARDFDSLIPWVQIPAFQPFLF